MEAVHGTHCNVRYSRPKQCKFCCKTIIWYSCDHLSVAGLPLDSRDPWIEHKCHKFNHHRWKKDVGSTPIGKFITREMSDDHIQSFDVVTRLNHELLGKRDQVQVDDKRTIAAIDERIRISEILLQLPENLRGKDLELPEGIKKRRRQILKQRAELMEWRGAL